jgi:RNA recognition motif-containing protein
MHIYKLSEVFSEYGEVTSATIIKDKVTGSSKGCAFLDMEEAGNEAIKALNGQDNGQENQRERSQVHCSFCA